MEGYKNMALKAITLSVFETSISSWSSVVEGGWHKLRCRSNGLCAITKRAIQEHQWTSDLQPRCSDSLPNGQHRNIYIFFQAQFHAQQRKTNDQLPVAASAYTSKSHNGYDENSLETFREHLRATSERSPQSRRFSCSFATCPSTFLRILTENSTGIDMESYIAKIYARFSISGPSDKEGHQIKRVESRNFLHYHIHSYRLTSYQLATSEEGLCGI